MSRQGLPAGRVAAPVSPARTHLVAGLVAGAGRTRFAPPASAVWAIAGVVHLLFWASLRSGWLAPLFTDSAHLYGPGCDFFALYQAGHNAWHGLSLYQPANAAQRVVPYLYPFRYLPVAAYTVGALFTLVPPATAYALWLGVNELCLLANASLTYRRCGGGLRGALLCAVWLCFSPLFVHLWLGQFTFVLASLLFWSVLAFEDGQWRRAQGWWMASVLWKPASLLWLPVWLRERRCWPGCALLGLLLLANGLYFGLHPGDYAWFRDSNLRTLSLWVSSNIGLSALVYQFTGSGPLFGPVRLAFSALLVLPALWVTFKPSRAAAPVPFWLLGAIWTTLYFLVYKEVWEQHLVLVLPFLVLGLWRAASRLLAFVTVLLALPAPFVFYDVPGLPVGADPQPFYSFGVSLLHHSWRVMPLLFLYGHWLALAGCTPGAGALMNGANGLRLLRLLRLPAAENVGHLAGR